MEFENVVKSRHSIRRFQPKEIEEEKLQKILELTNLAPSAGNLQALEIFVVKDKTKKQLLAQAADQDFISEAPVVLVFCSNLPRSSKIYGKRGEQLYSLQDATIAATFAMLTMTDLGLATVWVGAFDDEEVLKVLGNPEGLVPIAILPVGYAAKKPYTTRRRKLEDLVHGI